MGILIGCLEKELVEVGYSWFVENCCIFWFLKGV